MTAPAPLSAGPRDSGLVTSTPEMSCTLLPDTPSFSRLLSPRVVARTVYPAAASLFTHSLPVLPAARSDRYAGMFETHHEIGGLYAAPA